MQIIDCPQRSPEWFAVKAGKVSASRVADVMAKIKSGEAAARRNYKAEIVAETITGKPLENGFVSADMLFGIEHEAEARAAYEVQTGVIVQEVGFVIHPSIERGGASPDGMIGEDGMVEIKVPRLATHLGYILAGVVPSEYQPQMLFQMDCCERAWNDFVSFRPDLPDNLQLFIARFKRDDARIKDMQCEVIVFLREVDEMVAKLKQRIK